MCLCLYVCVFTRLWRGSELHLWLLCLYWLLWSSRQVTLISHLYFSICISAFQLVCMIGILFSKYMLCLEHLVVCSHPKPLLGKSFSHTWLLPNAAFSFWLWIFFLKLWKLTTLMKHLGGMVWLVVYSWVATQGHVHLGHMVVIAWGYTCGLPPRNKEIW